MPQTYEQSGVDIDAGESVVSHIKQIVRSTYSKGVLGGVGGFAALYDARFKGYKSPILVSSTDGVGTKLKVAQLMNRHDTVGQDLVNHCVNDILVCGAKPLFFMDYFATGKLNLDVNKAVMWGFVTACKENGCALIGGETAEMPGFYSENEYDLSGFIVGVVEKKKLITGKGIREGDVLIGLASSGLHTNGYSLARAVLLGRFSLDHYMEELGSTVGEALLRVHRSYLRVILEIISKFQVRGLSHITGGGIVGNTNRILPKGLDLNINWGGWVRPPIFQIIQRTGEVPEHDMRRTFNLGIGFVIVVPRKKADQVLKFIHKKGEIATIIGEVISRK